MRNFDSILDKDGNLITSGGDGLAAPTAVHVSTGASHLSQRNSEALVDLTPASEALQRDATHSEYFSPAAESHPPAYSESENYDSQVFYVHPDNVSDGIGSPFGGFHEHSAASSTADSFSHVGESDSLSDGTLSDAGHDRIATPASWSEVSSVVSEGHQ